MTYLEKVEDRLDLPPAVKRELLRELDSHMADIREELLASGMDSAAADAEVENRMGKPEDIAYRLNAAHNTAGWRSTALAVLPFAAVFLLPLLQYGKWLVVAAGAVMVVGSVRELLRGRRPIWLSTWLAVALLYVTLSLAAVAKAATDPPVDGVLVGMGALMIISLVVAYSVKRWLRIMGAISSIYILCMILILINPTASLGPLQSIALAILVPVLPITLVIFARCVFELHPYGNSVRAALFLLSVYMLSFNVFTEEAGVLYSVAVVALTISLVAWIARAKTRGLKTVALKVAVAFFAVLWSFDRWGPGGFVTIDIDIWSINIISGIVMIAIHYYVSTWLILFPIYSESK